MLKFTNFLFTQGSSFVFALIIFSSSSGLSCSNSTKTMNVKNESIDQKISPKLSDDAKEQIGEYIFEIFEDSKGNLWIGTLSKGVARYDGNSLVYFTTEDGLSGNAVISIVEDNEGMLWFGTHSGLSKYDGNQFINYSVSDGLCHDRISFLLIDTREKMWIGSWGGVCQFDGEAFVDFPLPVPDIVPPSYQETEEWITEIMEDRQGNIWFGRSGYAVCKYDGNSFTHFTTEDGLPSNCIQAITEDGNGNIWFGSRITEKDHPDENMRMGAGGLSYYDQSENKIQRNNLRASSGKDDNLIIQFSDMQGLSKVDIYSVFKDKDDNIWIGANGTGIYKYDGQKFTLFDKVDNADLENNIRGIGSFMTDRKGVLWFGLSGGLYRLDDTIMTNVTKDGPWM